MGPLRFGMSHDEVVAVLGGTSPVVWRSGDLAEFGEVTAYYGDSEQLMCVAVDAVHGPQVTLEDLPLAVLLTRPVFVAREWSGGVTDAQLGFIPQYEWTVTR